MTRYLMDTAQNEPHLTDTQRTLWHVMSMIHWRNSISLESESDSAEVEIVGRDTARS